MTQRGREIFSMQVDNLKSIIDTLLALARFESVGKTEFCLIDCIEECVLCFEFL